MKGDDQVDLSNKDVSYLIESLFQDYILSTLTNKDQPIQTLIQNCEHFFPFAKKYQLRINYENLKDFLIARFHNGEELYNYIQTQSLLNA